MHILFSFSKVLYNVQQENNYGNLRNIMHSAGQNILQSHYLGISGGRSIQQHITLVNSAQITEFDKLTIILNEEA